MRRQLFVLSNLVLVFVFVVFSTASAQTAKPAIGQKPVAKASTPATPNDELIKLAKAGLSEDILLAVVAKADKSKYDTSADGLLKLKAGGVSDKVIASILGISVATPAPAPAPVQPTTPVPTSTTQHIGVSLDGPSTQSLEGREAGIYLMNGTELEQLEPSVYSGGKTGNKFWGSVTSLVPTSIKAVVRSAKANQRIQTSMPTFYFFFEVKGAGLSNTGSAMSGFNNSASSPNEFVLVRMKVSTDEREVVIGKSSAFSDRNGVPSKDTVDFVIKKIKQGVYEVKPRNPMTAGEYCFFYAAGTANEGGVGKVFDFGVDVGASPQ